MTYDFSRIYERQYVGKNMKNLNEKLYSVHESNFCIDVPSHMKFSYIPKHVEMKLTYLKSSLVKISECPHTYKK